MSRKPAVRIGDFAAAAAVLISTVSPILNNISDRVRIAAQAVDLLLALIDPPAGPALRKRILVEPALIVRDSRASI